MIRTVRVLLAAVGILAAVALLAQSPVSVGNAVHPVASAHPLSPAPPAPTELERTEIENIQLKMMLLSDEERSIPERRQQLQQQYGYLVQQIQKEHPGYVWNPQSGVLVPVPKPAARPEVKK